MLLNKELRIVFIIIPNILLSAYSGEWEDNKPPAKVPMRKHTSGGLAICFSACQDNQMAADTTVKILKLSFFIFYYCFFLLIFNFLCNAK